MPIVMSMEWPGITREDYDRVEAVLRIGDEGPPGGLLHIAGQERRSWRVIDVWESRDAWSAFFDTQLLPALQQTGMLERKQPDVRLFPVYNLYMPDPDGLARHGGLSPRPG